MSEHEQVVPLGECVGHDIGNKTQTCINCARALGRKEGEERAAASAPLAAEEGLIERLEGTYGHTSLIREVVAALRRRGAPTRESD